jgi:hypothetical protein
MTCGEGLGEKVVRCKLGLQKLQQLSMSSVLDKHYGRTILAATMGDDDCY